MEQSECSKLISKNTWSTVPPQAAKLESKNKNGHGNLGVSELNDMKHKFLTNKDWFEMNLTNYI